MLLIPQFSMPHRILVEGWRFLCHSYAITNQFQLLELLRRPAIELRHRDMPYIDPAWQTDTSLRDETVQVLRTIPAPTSNWPADVTLRLYCPWNFAPSRSPQTWVFAATEWGTVTETVLQGIGVSSLAETPVNTGARIVTPSEWSKAGLIRSGVHADRIAVVPLGVDPQLYHPPAPEHRAALRKSFGWENEFVFLNIGGCTDRKGIRPLLKAFALTLERYPHSRLVLKGSELLYPSKDEIARAGHLVLSSAEREKVASQVTYLGHHLTFEQLVQLYHAADAYVSPYLAEGFNLPVLEAMACGLPVICTKGGPTDDFTRPELAFPIESRLLPLHIDGENLWVLEPNVEHLTILMQNLIEQPALVAKVRQAAPPFVRENFTWTRVVDQLIQVFAGPETSAKINKPTFEPIIL